MRYRKRPPESSLGLLLDTICNTFGGVLFLAMLLAVLLRMTTQFESFSDSERPSELELLALAENQTATLARLESLRQAVVQQEKLTDQFFRPESAQLLMEFKQLRTMRDELVSDRLEALGRITSIHANIAKIAEERRELDVALKRARAEMAEAIVSLKAELVKRTHTARLPRLRSTSKQEIGLVVRYGRLYVWHRYDRHGFRLGLNTDDFVVVKDHNDYIETTPKPYGGIPIADPSSRATLVSKLRQFDSRTQYLALIVWGDSFESFNGLKNLMVELGFEYRLIPVVPGEGVIDRGGTGARVQ